LIVSGIPSFYLLLLYMNHELIVREGKSRMQQMDALNKGISDAGEGENTDEMEDALKQLMWDYEWPESVSSLSFLFVAYKPEVWWWEVFECVRRLLLTGKYNHVADINIQ
jgi:hypothetical protein